MRGFVSGLFLLVVTASFPSWAELPGTPASALEHAPLAELPGRPTLGDPFAPPKAPSFPAVLNGLATRMREALKRDPLIVRCVVAARAILPALQELKRYDAEDYRRVLGQHGFRLVKELDGTGYHAIVERNGSLVEIVLYGNQIHALVPVEKTLDGRLVRQGLRLALEPLLTKPELVLLRERFNAASPRLNPFVASLAIVRDPSHLPDEPQAYALGVNQDPDSDPARVSTSVMDQIAGFLVRQTARPYRREAVPVQEQILERYFSNPTLSLPELTR